MSFTPSEKDIENYNQLKVELLRQLRKGKIFRNQDCPGHVGLMNQGATCYLNSLLQTLFHIPAFKNFILKIDSQTKIVTALKKLFASLILSEDCAISTKEITTAFGWSNSEVFDQHDIQELFCSMTDALSQESSEMDTFLNENFKGILIGNTTTTPGLVHPLLDSLECPSCGYKKESNVSYQDVPLNLTDKSSGVFLTELLHNFCAVEVLDSNNLWTCGKCSEKVAAKKSSQFDSLPSTLFLHLKRLSYDQNLQQRKKISTPVYFPLTLSEAEIKSAGNPNVTYKLSSVLIHLGTASGGHYKAYIHSKGKWFEYDDAHVLELSNEDLKKLFWCTSPADIETKNNSEATDLIMKGFSIYEGAYMLVYQVDNATTTAEENTDIASAIPPEIAQEVKSANEQLATFRRANEVHKLMTELSCFKITADSGSHVKPSNITLTPVTCHLIGLKTLNDALGMIYDAFVKNGVINSSEITLSMCRLRRYNPSSRMVGETFTSRETQSLTDLGLSPLSSLALEVLSPGGTFTDFNPKEVEVRLLEWKDNKLPIQDDGHTDVFINVIGEENATVGGLRSRVAEYYAVSDVNRIILARNDVKSSYLELSEDASLLTSGYNVRSGDDVIVCVLPEGQSRFDGKGVEFTKALQAQKRSITIFYNTPTATNEEEGFGGGVSYDHSVAVCLDDTLGELKKLISQALKISIDSFYLRRNANSPQLKKLNTSLDDIGFVDQGIVHVQYGQQIAPGEHILQCELDLTSDDQDWKVVANDKSSLLVGEVVVKEKMTCLQLKELILSQWEKIVGNHLPIPKSVNHIRLRDGQTGGQSGPLRDTRILGRTLVGLGDGRKLIIQSLSEPEILTADNLFVTLRIMSFQDKIISRPLSITVPRSCTTRQFYRLVLDKYHSIDETPPPLDSASQALADVFEKFPECRIISIAKAYNSGPPLTMKSSLKLKWNDEPIIRDPDTAIDKSPFGLRDGSILVIRNVADFERARDAARARVAERPSSSVGGIQGDSPARGRIRPTSRVKSRSGKREKGITINVESQNEAAPPPPDPSPSKTLGDGLNARYGTGELIRSPRMDITDENATDIKNGLTLPNAPVRIVKVLRSPRPGEEIPAADA